jgi:hypothetical protein
MKYNKQKAVQPQYNKYFKRIVHFRLATTSRRHYPTSCGFVCTQRCVVFSFFDQTARCVIIDGNGISKIVIAKTSSINKFTVKQISKKNREWSQVLPGISSSCSALINDTNIIWYWNLGGHQYLKWIQL